MSDLHPALPIRIPGRANQNSMGYVLHEIRLHAEVDSLYFPLGAANGKCRPVQILRLGGFCHRLQNGVHARPLRHPGYQPSGIDSLLSKARPLDKYIDEFQDLIADSRYSDLKTIVVKFWRGLSAQIQNSVATMASRRPSNASLEAWYAMARVVDQNRAANEAFTSTF